ncbi:hypothetical protein BU25DRAFT_202017 [Macroventuria anomochaeta]|uniref:Uncharacterized protein n=1 Tax=Macroventuria anomochaeta TaxID=301207 RepID=A0ACB6RMA9_9PLEO|nr:uncharacterized protein BU25DRAFT_202017 [Macroventuria anomochaeta]KAF2622847.1 hypothetical protein BU25DRAFT_202017 [Macroventuria anomochaeta]
MQEREQSILPRLLPTNERAICCCAFPKNCGSTLLSRTLFVQMLLSVEMKVPLQKGCDACQTKPDYCVVFPQLLDSYNNANTKVLGGEPPSVALPHQIAYWPSSIEDLIAIEEACCPASELRGSVAATTGCAEWLAFTRLPLELSSLRGVTIHSCSHPSSEEKASVLQPSMCLKGVCREARWRFRFPAGGSASSWRLGGSYAVSDQLGSESTWSAMHNETWKVKLHAEKRHCALQRAQSHSAS